MQMLAFAKLVLLDSTPLPIVGANTVVSTVSVPFNPIKLFFLVGWVYLCLYIVQRIQFSQLIPKNQKVAASIIALFLGPLLLLALILLYSALLGFRTLTKSAQEHGIKEQIQSAIASLRSAHFAPFQRDSTIRLLNTSGAELKEIYTHGKSKRKDSHVLDLTEQIIWNALEERASDILIDPKDETTYSIRFRIDGVLREIEQIETNMSKAVVSSIKAVSNMDIAERRRPQDGSFIAKTADGTTSFRVASAGTISGEKLSIRVLNQDASRFKLENIGLSEKQKIIIKSAISKPNGMILMCGPTGSGKTTTLYSMLNKIDLYLRNVITVEDPIEYVLQNASQIEVNPKADITFSKTLRSILRQDPDVICVGEIRDEETAAIALRAAQTGHLVLATIHSNSPASSLIRLLDLEVSALLISSGISLIVSQRLLRCLCKYCRIPAKLTQNQILYLRRKKINYKTIYQPKGCEHCYGTGYRGRTAIFDFLVFDDNLRASIANNKLSVGHLRKEGDKRGQSNLQKQGIKAVVSGITSLEELMRVVG